MFHFQSLFTHPHVMQDVHVFLSFENFEKKLSYLRKTFLDFFSILWTSMGTNGLKVQIGVFKGFYMIPAEE